MMKIIKLLQPSTTIQQVTIGWNEQFDINHKVVDLFIMIHIKASIITLNKKFTKFL
jgi:hypothetical protein